MPQTGDLAQVAYLVAWEPTAELLRSLPTLKVLFSSGAGIVNGMTEYLTMAVLRRAVLGRLAPFGFCLHGWSRRPKSIPGVRSWAGTDSLDRFLSHCEILVCLLPLTEELHGILGSRPLAALPAGATLINFDRGGHLDQQGLLAALDSGHLTAAMLDVCDPEPLPRKHPFWRHPRIILTPHFASETQPETAAPVVIGQIRRFQECLPLANTVDRETGY